MWARITFLQNWPLNADTQQDNLRKTAQKGEDQQLRKKIWNTSQMIKNPIMRIHYKLEVVKPETDQ